MKRGSWVAFGISQAALILGDGQWALFFVAVMAWFFWYAEPRLP